MLVKITVNGKVFQDDIKPDLRLIDYLRDKGFYSVKCGCETSNCGLCTVWMDNRSVLSCSILAVRADGHSITTLEGVEKQAHEFAVFMANEGAEQCGFCSPGLIMNVLAMKNELTDPSDDEIRRYLAGNLCRCTGYTGQMRAITKYLRQAGESDEAGK